MVYLKRKESAVIGATAMLEVIALLEKLAEPRLKEVKASPDDV